MRSEAGTPGTRARKGNVPRQRHEERATETEECARVSVSQAMALPLAIPRILLVPLSRHAFPFPFAVRGCSLRSVTPGYPPLAAVAAGALVGPAPHCGLGSLGQDILVVHLKLVPMALGAG